MKLQNQYDNLIFGKDAVNNIVGFCNTLKNIHERLIQEGYVIEDGKITYKGKGSENTKNDV